MRQKRVGCLPVLMAISLIVILVIGWIYYKDGKTYTDLKTEVTYKKKEIKNKKKDDGYRINWKALKNKDVVAWIRFKHPKIISYPVMKKNDNDFYLHRNIKKKYSFAGSIFMDYHNNKDFSDSNTLIYGHNMANGSMFGSLKKYTEKSYWAKNKYFYIYTRDGKRRKYKIYNTCMVRPGSEIYTYHFASEKSIKDYIEYYQSFGEYPTGINPSVKDKLVTLSTCALQGSRRFVVQGYLVETITLD